MHILLIRHGRTKGNSEKRYIGTTDESLSEEGKEEIKKIKHLYADIVISSPLKRCIETAEILFGKTDIICGSLRECDFGDFENKNYDELRHSEYYIKWLESYGKLPFPNGESHNEFCLRCTEGFHKIVDNFKNQEKTLAFVIHGGTVMAICEKFEKPHKTFYDRQLPNGGILEFSAEFVNGEIILTEMK
jgi:alpha-ribazole phosphatase